MSDNPHNLLVIKASAGSGKTYRLALEYIRHLLFAVGTDGVTLTPHRADADTRLLNIHRQMLAITFTNKATDEMKQRIVNELYRLSQPGVKSDYLNEFMQHSGLDEPSVRSLARHALNELLFDYSNFNVSTIDSFFQTILRNFARELDRDFNYDIQLEEDYAVRVAVHNFLLSLGKEGMPTQVNQWVQDYQRHMIRGDAEKKNWKFFDDSGDLNRFAKNINSELFRSKMAAIRAYLGHVNEQGVFECDFSKIRAFKQLINDTVKRCNDEIEDGYGQLRQILSPLGVKGSFKNWLAKGGNTPFDLQKTWSDVTREKVEGQFLKGQLPDDATIDRLHGLMTDHKRLRLLADFFQHIEDNLGLLGMLAMIDLFLEEYRHETNSILIGDTNELIGTVLKSGTNFVYERVGTIISNFMIDEFQDTSTKQYENFSDLLHESLSAGNFNMLIGDAKQSIYRFRNADLTVFRERVGKDFNGYITDGRRDADPAKPEGPSSTNYRSSRHIIEFNNELFAFLNGKFQDRSSVVDTYGDVEQGMPRDIDTGKLPGYVRLMTANYGAQLSPGGDAGDNGGDAPSAGSDASVEEVLPAYLLWLHERYGWGRIGILVNANSEGDKVVECILDYNKHTTGEKIHIISGESLLLNNSPIIRRIIAMLRFIDISQFSADDEDAEAEVANDDIGRRLMRKRQSDRRLYTAMNEFIQAVAASPDGSPTDNGALLVQSLQTVIDDGGAGESGESGDDSRSEVSTLEQLLPPAGELTTLVSIVETIIAHFKKHPGSSGDVDREVAFLMAFQDTVMQFSAQRNGGSVREFLKFWDEKKNKLAVSSADGGDAINIMTIHKAKGLEFDCVVIPYAKWELDGNSQEKNYWMPREQFVETLNAMLPADGQCDMDLVPPLLHIGKTTAVELNRMGVLGDKAAAFVDKQVDDVLIDNLNKTYVAMTRPRTELHIFSGGGSNTVAPLLEEFAGQSGVMTPVPGIEGWYEKGTLSSLQDMKELARKKAEQSAGEPEQQTERVGIGEYTVNDIPLQLRVRVDHASSTSIDAGLRLHGLLGRIRDLGNVDRVIDDGLKHGVITTGDPDDPCGIDSVNAHVRDVIKDPAIRVAAWFDPANTVYSERTITSVSTNVWDEDGIENMRPDRIVRRPDGQLIVIDYKSGQRNDKRYLRQLGRYMDKLRAIFPDAPIAGRIWYVTHDLILDHHGKELGLKG